MKTRKMKYWNGIVVTAALIVLCCNTKSMAQGTDANTIPHALKDIQQATGVCHKDDVLSSDSGASAIKEYSADLSCAISSSELQTLQTRPNSALLDLRQMAEYESFHIQGALNLNTSDLHSKPYWRDKNVVLIGNGKTEEELYKECSRLKHTGYKQVRVLRGGMPAWLTYNYSITGRAPSVRQLTRLSPAEFWVESNNLENVVLLAKEQSALKPDISFSSIMPQVTDDAIKVVLERRRKELKNAPFAAVILALDPTSSDEQIHQLQSALLPIPILIYTDTRDAYLRQLAVQKAIWSAQAKGPKQPGCGL